MQTKEVCYKRLLDEMSEYCVIKYTKNRLGYDTTALA